MKSQRDVECNYKNSFKYFVNLFFLYYFFTWDELVIPSWINLWIKIINHIFLNERWVGIVYSFNRDGQAIIFCIFLHESNYIDYQIIYTDVVAHNLYLNSSLKTTLTSHNSNKTQLCIFPVKQKVHIWKIKQQVLTIFFFPISKYIISTKMHFKIK